MGYKLERPYHFIKHLDNALDWQREAMSRIHTYNRSGSSTVLFFNERGIRLPDHKKQSFSVPIQYFAPENEQKLFEYLSSMKKAGKLTAFIEDMNDVDGLIAMPARKYLQKTRKPDFLYHPTPE